MAITLLVVAWSGSLLLGVFGTTVDSVRAAGGVIVLLVGHHMRENMGAAYGPLPDRAFRQRMIRYVEGL